MATIRLAAFVALTSSFAVGLAAPASADLVDGTYQRSGDGPAGSMFSEATVTVTSCGPGCKNLAGSVRGDEVVQMHLEGNTWTGTDSTHTVLTIDNDSLTGTETSPFLRNPVNSRYVKID